MLRVTQKFASLSQRIVARRRGDLLIARTSSSNGVDLPFIVPTFASAECVTHRLCANAWRLSADACPRIATAPAAAIPAPIFVRIPAAICLRQ